MYQFAIIGCGRIAPRHAENIQKHGILKAVCDVVPEKANSFASRFNCRAYYRLEDLLQQEPEITVVAICTPNGFHAEHVIKCLQAGRHVLCEKPLCLTTAAAWQIIETEKFCRRRVFLVNSNRYNAALLQLNRLADEGQLGKIYSFHLSCLWNRPPDYYTDWHGTLFPDGGTLYTQFSHYIDALIWLLGEVEQVKGFRHNYAHRQNVEFEDTGAAAMVLQSGIMGTLHWSVNSYQKNFEIGLTLLAEKGTVRLGGTCMNEVQYQQTSGGKLIPEPINDVNNCHYRQNVMSNHNEMYAHLFRVLQQNDNSFPSAYEGLKTVAAIEKIYNAVTLL